MNEIVLWSAGDTAERVQSGEVSVREVVSAHVDRMAEVNPSLNAIVEDLGQAALDEARAKDNSGPEDRPLWGVPITIKVNTDQAGTANTNGLPALADNLVREDAAVVRNLRQAGAVILGRTNTPEFSLRWFTSNPLHGVTLNPWDKAVTPGGSSGGASAAVAAGVGCLGHGNDLGGSLRYPAYCVGAATLRASLGRVPAVNPAAPGPRPMMIASMSVQGVIARSIKDVALALPSLSVGDHRDPLWRSAPQFAPLPSSAPGRRVGLCVDPFGDGVAPQVAQAVQAAGAAAKAAGCELVDVMPPDATGAAEVWGQLLNAETEATSKAQFEDMGSPELLAVLHGYSEFYGIPGRDAFIDAMMRRSAMMRAWAEMFQGIDALILPVSAALPFAVDQDFRDPDGLAEVIRAQRALVIINMLGLPAATVRVQEADPVPLGVQVVGPMMGDEVALEVATLIEDELALDLGPINPR